MLCGTSCMFSARLVAVTMISSMTRPSVSASSDSCAKTTKGECTAMMAMARGFRRKVGWPDTPTVRSDSLAVMNSPAGLPNPVIRRSNTVFVKLPSHRTPSEAPSRRGDACRRPWSFGERRGSANTGADKPRPYDAEELCSAAMQYSAPNVDEDRPHARPGAGSTTHARPRHRVVRSTAAGRGVPGRGRLDRESSTARRCSTSTAARSPSSLCFIDLAAWPRITVARDVGWNRLGEYAQPVVDEIVARNYEPGGVVIRSMAVRLPGGARITPHVDEHESLRLSHRIHLPLTTNPRVRFFIDGVPYRFEPGACGGGQQPAVALGHERQCG